MPSFILRGVTILQKRTGHTNWTYIWTYVCSGTLIVNMGPAAYAEAFAKVKISKIIFRNNFRNNNIFQNIYGNLI